MSHLVLLPIIVPLAGAVVALFLMRAPRWQGVWTLGVMGTAVTASTILLWTVFQTGEPVVFYGGGWEAPFGIALVGDLLGALLALMSQAVLLMGTIYALGATDKNVRYPGFYPLFLMLTTGLTGAFLTGDLFNLFVFAELLVISGTVLTAISDDKLGTEAAYKYFYISLLSAAFLLLANGVLYVSYGTLNMADLAERIAADPTAPLLTTGIALLMATFMIKSAVFPFHFWQPDFHTAAPTAVSAMLSSVVVKLGVYGFMRMTTLLFAEQAALIQTLLIILGVIGIFYGGFSAIGTHNVKRMLAYSTLAQIGFILVGVGWGTPLSLVAALVFTINHSLIKAAMLMLAGFVASRASVKSAAFAVVTGLGRQLPLAGILFFVGALALAGIPPTNGFISKLLLFNSGVEATQLAVLSLMAVGSLATLIYTMRAFQRIWWEPQVDTAVTLKPSGDRLIAPGILIGLTLLLGLWAEPLLQLAETTTRWLGQPELYITAVLTGG
jgi:multicomponent Na+:H+ antiporter subunit D